MAGFVVTGGTGALGSAVVRALIADGGRVAVPYRSAAGWETLYANVDPDALWGSRTDVADPGAASAFMAEAARRLDGIAGLACVAGAYAGAGTLETAPDAIARVILFLLSPSSAPATGALVPVDAKA